MKKNQTKINFDLTLITDNELEKDFVTVNDVFIVSLKPYRSGMRFIIPKTIVKTLQLKRSDDVYFIKYSENYFISFKKHNKDAFTTRKIQTGGMYNTCYVQFPKSILLENPKTNHIQLYQSTATVDVNLWQLNNLSIDSY